jgi:outer membrane immunogenic protein
MQRFLVMIGTVMPLAIGSVAQESRSEIGLQGTGFFTKNSSGRGNVERCTETDGFTVGYRYHRSRWLSAEGNYGYDRNTQQYFGGVAESRVQANAHSVTGDLAVKLPLPVKRVSPYVVAGGGGLIFDPTGNPGGFVPGASTQGRGAFLYGAGADYAMTWHFSLRAEYRGFVYKSPAFGLASLRPDSWTQTAQPSAGIVFRF